MRTNIVTCIILLITFLAVAITIPAIGDMSSVSINREDWKDDLYPLVQQYITCLYGIEIYDFDEMSIGITQSEYDWTCVYTAFITFQSQPEYEFILTMDDGGALISYTNPLLLEQMMIQENTNDYPSWWNERLLEKESEWGDSIFWNYEQRYTFMIDSYGWGITGTLGVFDFPDSNCISPNESLSICVEEFELKYPDLNFEETKTIIHYIGVPDLISYKGVPRRSAYWNYYIISADYQQQLLFLCTDASNGSVLILDTEQKGITDNMMQTYKSGYTYM